MSLFGSNIDTSVDATNQQDIVAGAGFAPLTSNVYDFEVTEAFIKVSPKGAYALSLTLKTADGQTHSEDIYYTNRNGENTYEDKKDKSRQPMPGYVMISALSLLLTNEDFPAQEKHVEKKTVQQYSRDANGMVPTSVDMIMSFVGKTIKATVLQELQNKKAPNDTGDYVPVIERGEPVLVTRTVIDKFLHSDGRSVTEIRAKKDPEATDLYVHKFLKQWKDEVRDVTDKSVKSNAGMAGMPSSAGSAGAGMPGMTTASTDTEAQPAAKQGSLFA